MFKMEMTTACAYAEGSDSAGAERAAGVASSGRRSISSAQVEGEALAGTAHQWYPEGNRPGQSNKPRTHASLSVRKNHTLPPTPSPSGSAVSHLSSWPKPAAAVCSSQTDPWSPAVTPPCFSGLRPPLLLAWTSRRRPPFSTFPSSRRRPTRCRQAVL